MRDSYADMTFRGAALADEDLRRADFTGCTFIDIEWAGRQLEEATFDNARFEGGSLAGANLQHATFRNARLRDVDATGAVFRGALMTRTQVFDVVLNRADLSAVRAVGATINGARVNNAIFRHATIRDSGFNFISGEGADFRDATLADLTDADQGVTEIELPYADFTAARLSSLDWQGSRLEAADFIGARLDRVMLHGADLAEAQFTDSDLSHVVFAAAELSGADFSHSSGATEPVESEPAAGAPRRRPASIRDTTFAHAQLTNAIFNGAILENCDLTAGHAEAAEFQGTRFDDCRLDGLVWRDAAPGWLTTEERARDAFYRAFLGERMALPYVPLDEAFDVVQSEDWFFHSTSWSDATPRELYFVDEFAQRVLRTAPEDGFAVSMGGHGMNSYAWTWAGKEGALTVIAQVARGLVYRNVDWQTSAWDECMRGITQLFAENRTMTDRRLLIEFSDMRKVAQWTWVSSDGHRETTAWQGPASDIREFFHASLEQAAKLS